MTATDITEELVLFLGGKCALCNKEYPDGKTWQIHHRQEKKGEKHSRDFKEKIPHIITRGKNKGKRKTKTVYHKQKYHAYIKPIVLGDPARFAPLHMSCHQSITRGARWSKTNGNRQRYCDLIMEQK